MWDFYLATVTYLQKKLPLTSKVLLSVSCLRPKNRIVEGSMRSIEYLAKVFPHVIKEEQLSQLKDEWLMCQVEPDNEIGNGDG